MTLSARGVKLTAFRWAAGSVCERAWDTTSLQGVHSIGSWNGLLLSSCACWVSLSPLSFSCYDNKASHGANCRWRQRQAGLQTHSLNAGAGKLIMIIALRPPVCASRLKQTAPLQLVQIFPDKHTTVEICGALWVKENVDSFLKYMHGSH